MSKAKRVRKTPNKAAKSPQRHREKKRVQQKLTASQIKVYLTALETGRATSEQKTALERNTTRVQAWLQTTEGQCFLYGEQSARTLRDAIPDEMTDAESSAIFFCNDCGELSVANQQKVLVRLLIDAFRRGFALGAATRQSDYMKLRVRGAAANSAKAKQTRRQIIEAYDATDYALPEAKRYALTKQVTRVKSDETIRKALRSR
jgi:hypothetical protein